MSAGDHVLIDLQQAMRPLYEKCELKNKLLLTVGGGGVPFASIQSKWEVCRTTIKLI